MFPSKKTTYLLFKEAPEKSRILNKVSEVYSVGKNLVELKTEYIQLE